MDDGELSDDESTATASDVDTDNSGLASTALLSDAADNQADSSTKEHTTAAKPSPDETLVLPDSGQDVNAEVAKSRPPVDAAPVPMVRLERLSMEKVAKESPEEVRVIQKQTLVAEHNYFSTSEPPPDDRGESRTSRESQQPMVDSDSSVDVVGTEPPAPLPTLPPHIAVDHCYCIPFLPTDDIIQPSVTVRVTANTAAPQRGTKRRLSDLTNVPGSRELSSILPPAAIPPPRPRYQPRDLKSEIMTLLEFILAGVDAEDIMFLQRRYEQLLQFDSTATDWLNDTHWVDHPPTFFIDPLPEPPPRKRRKFDKLEDRPGHHLTGQ